MFGFLLTVATAAVGVVLLPVALGLGVLGWRHRRDDGLVVLPFAVLFLLLGLYALALVEGSIPC